MIRPRSGVTAAIQIELLPSRTGALGDDPIVATLRRAVYPGLHRKSRIARGRKINGNIGHITIVSRQRAKPGRFMSVEQIVSCHAEQHIGVSPVKASYIIVGD